jgi:glycosyltransferase involved in cell wall biosynthesis
MRRGKQKKLEEKARQLDIADKVKFSGKLFCGETIYYNELDKADLHMLPFRTEGLSPAILAAVARGLPCVGSNIGGFPEPLECVEMINRWRSEFYRRVAV